MNKTIAKSITKTIDICAKPEKVFQFLSNPMNWPQFAIVNLKSVRPGTKGVYEILSKNGSGQIQMLSNEKLGILDHIWRDKEASWTVFMRAMPNFEGTTLSTTFFQPEQLPQGAFDQSMRDMDIEFAKLKEVLEK